MMLAGTQPGRGEVARAPQVPEGLGMGSYPISQGGSLSRMPTRRPARVTIDATGSNSKSSSSSSPDHGKMKQAKERIDVTRSSSDDMQAGEAMTMDQVTAAEESEEQADSGSFFDDGWETTYTAARFAFGDKVFKLSCQLLFDGSDGKLNLSYCHDNRSSTEVVVTLDLKSELQELKFFTADYALDTAQDAEWTHPIYFLAMRVKMSEFNGLRRMGEWYKPNEFIMTDDKLHHDMKQRYILVQFDSHKGLRDVVDIMRRIVSPKPKSVLELVQLRSAQANLYFVPFLPQGEAEREHWFKQWPRPITKTNPFAGKNETDIIFCYPFAAIINIQSSEHSPLVIRKQWETAALGLNEARRGGPASLWRSEAVILKAGCHARLRERWLNDEIVNFWMKW
jgi:hypothetical protein